MRQMRMKEQQHKARRRANSEATEVPPIFSADTMTEAFQEMEMNGIRFNTVKLFHPRPGVLLFPCVNLFWLSIVSDIGDGVHG